MGTRSTRELWEVCLFLLAYLLTRLHHLAALPLFVDESYYTQFAQRVLDGQPLASASEGRLLRVWLNAFFGPYPPGISWVIRAGTILVCLLGAAAFYRLVRSFVSPRAGLLALTLLILSPYSIFFERLALADPLVSALSVAAVLCIWRLARTADWKMAVLLGVMIAASILAKASGIVWIPLPFAALLLLRDVPWKKRLLLVGIAFAIVVFTWGPLLVLLHSKSYGYFGTATNRMGGAEQSIFHRIWDNSQTLWQIDRTYLSLPAIILALLGELYWLRRQPRSALFALFVLGLGAGGIVVFGQNLNSRYAFNQAIWVLLPLVVGAGLLMERWRRAQWVVYAALIVWAAVFALPFLLDAWNHPADLPLLADDRLAYITGEASGYGVREAGQMLHRLDDDLPALGFVANCQTLRIAADPHDVTCPVIHWDTTNQEALLQVQQAAAAGPIYVVGENVVYLDLSLLPQPNTLIATFARPGGKTPVLLYRIDQGATLP